MKATKAYQAYTEFLASNPGMVLPSSGVVEYNAEVSSLLAMLREQEAAASTPYPNYYTEFLTSKAGLAMRDSVMNGEMLSEPQESDMMQEDWQAYMNVVIAISEMYEGKQ